MVCRNEKKICFPKRVLVTMLRMWNKLHPEDMVSLKKTKQQLWDTLQKKLEPVCQKDQSCWVDYLNLSRAKAYIKPIMPRDWIKDPDTWLTNFDIIDAMNVPNFNFTFLGVFPIDFQDTDVLGKCIGDMMCTFDIRTLKTSYFGVVFNLSPHWHSGSHWICVYSGLDPELTNYGFFYYDSLSLPVPSSIKKFGKKIKKQVQDSTFKLYKSHKEQQKLDGQCGMYCINFLLSCMKGKSALDLYKEKISDAKMRRLRTKIFRSPPLD